MRMVCAPFFLLGSGREIQQHIVESEETSRESQRRRVEGWMVTCMAQLEEGSHAVASRRRDSSLPPRRLSRWSGVTLFLPKRINGLKHRSGQDMVNRSGVVLITPCEGE
jgi:hypothetical protein